MKNLTRPNDRFFAPDSSVSGFRAWLKVVDLQQEANVVQTLLSVSGLPIEGDIRLGH